MLYFSRSLALASVKDTSGSPDIILCSAIFKADKFFVLFKCLYTHNDNIPSPFFVIIILQVYIRIKL